MGEEKGAQTEKTEATASSVLNAVPTKAVVHDEHHHSPFHSSTVILIIFSICFGFIGGWVSTTIKERNARNSLTGNTTIQKQVIAEQSELIAEIANDVGPSVVSIKVRSVAPSSSYYYDGLPVESESAGTGIVLNKEGYIATNKHVVPTGLTKVTVVMSDGTTYEDVSVISRDPLNDIAFLKINKPGRLKPAKLGDSSKVRVGERVVAIGNALGQFDNTVTSGIISGLGRPIEAGIGNDTELLQNLFQTDASINPGNSGGPLVNIDGEVIGINTAVATEAENIGFAIPINDVKPAIASVEKNGKLIRPYVGTRYVMITEDIAAELNLSRDQGALVVSGGEGRPAVAPNGPADKAGIREGDIIVKVNKIVVDRKTNLVAAISAYEVGDTITVVIDRDGKEQTVKIKLEAAPEQ